MPWVLAAKGDADPKAEKELQEKLTALLSNPKYGAQASHLSSSVHNGPVHVKAAEKKSAARD